MKALFCEYYKANVEKRKASFRAYHVSHRSARLRYFRKYHCATKHRRVRKARYSLAQPNQLLIEKYVRSGLASLLADREVMLKLKEEFKSLHATVAGSLSKTKLERTVGKLAVRRLVCKALQIRRNLAGVLLPVLSV